MASNQSPLSDSSFTSSALGSVGAAVALAAIIGFFYGLFHWPIITLVFTGYSVLSVVVLWNVLVRSAEGRLVVSGFIAFVLSLVAAFLLGGDFSGPNGVPFRVAADIVLALSAVAFLLLWLGAALSKGSAAGLALGVAVLALCVHGFPPPSESSEAHHPHEHKDIYTKTSIVVTLVTRTRQPVKAADLWITWKKDEEDVWMDYWEHQYTDQAGQATFDFWFDPKGLVAHIYFDFTDHTHPRTDWFDNIELRDLRQGETRRVRLVGRKLN